MSAAIITGAANGIGAACAEVFAGAGWDLVLVDRDESALQREAVRVAVLAGDVTDRAVNESAVSLAEERFGRLDAVVANAGVTSPAR